MLFNQFGFGIFFITVVFVYFICPRKIRAIWLLVCSYFFYMCWDWKYALIILFSTIITYFVGIAIKQKERNTKYIFIIGLLLNIFLLIFFKYYQFIFDNVISVLDIFHVNLKQPSFQIILPIGISFYTFRIISYLSDVYKGKMEAEFNFINFALYISFFPLLLSGPIERAKELIPQINNIKNKQLWNYQRFTSGLCLMLWGYFLKMVIADRLGLFVDAVFNDFTNYKSSTLILAVICFAGQIYTDFAGYSLIAIGIARILDLTISNNFDKPYFSQSISEFWHRWHISLSTWLRDYIYIPLGGNRRGKAIKYRNILITFLISGFWHGSGWSYVVWGGIHGIYQIVGDWTSPTRKRISNSMHVKTECLSNKVLKVIVTFILVDFAWIFFRANSLKEALGFIKHIVYWSDIQISTEQLWNIGGLNTSQWHILAISLLILYLVSFFEYESKERIEVLLSKQCIWFRWIFIFFLLYLVLIWGVYGPGYCASEFVYIKF